MATPVVTVAAGGLPIVDVTATFPKLGLPVTEALNGRGVAVTKVAANGLPVTFKAIGNDWPFPPNPPPTSGSGAFTPANLTGLIGWWDASVAASLVTSGGFVLTAADQSGGGNNLQGWFTGSGGPAYNATGFNSKPAFVFSSPSNHALAPVSGTIPMGTGNTLTAWYVGTFGTTINARLLSYIAGGQTQDYNNAASWALVAGGTASTTLAFNRNNLGPAYTGTAGNHTVIATVSAAGLCTIYVDGVSVASTTSAGNWVSGANQFCFGRSASAGLYWNGPVGEAGVATGFTDATTVVALHAYLKTKWGL